MLGKVVAARQPQSLSASLVPQQEYVLEGLVFGQKKDIGSVQKSHQCKIQAFQQTPSNALPQLIKGVCVGMLKRRQRSADLDTSRDPTSALSVIQDTIAPYGIARALPVKSTTIETM